MLISAALLLIAASVALGQCPPATAGPDVTVCAPTVLSGNNPVTGPGGVAGGTGSWTATGGATFDDATRPDATVTVPANTASTLTWTTTGPGCTTPNSASLVVTNTPLVPLAGPAQTVCGTTLTLAGNAVPGGVTGLWTRTGGLGDITTPTSPTSTVTGLSGSPLFTWTFTRGTCSASNSVTHTQTPLSASAGPAQTVCSGALTLAGSAPPAGATGTWTVAGGASIASPNTANSAVTGLTNSALFTWTITSPGCTSSAAIVAHTQQLLLANAGPNQPLGCVRTTTMAANSPSIVGASGTWTRLTGTATIASNTSPVTQVTNVAGVTQLQWTLSAAGCASSSSTVTLTQTALVANAGANQNIGCGTTATLAANTPSQGTGAWTVTTGSATFANAASPTSAVTINTPGTTMLTWTVTSGTCTPAVSSMTITNFAAVTPANAGPNQALAACASSTTLAATNPTSGTGTWSVVAGAGTFVNANAFNTVVNGLSGNPSITLRWTVSAPNCMPSAAEVSVTTSAPTTPIAGPSQIGCFTSVTMAANTPIIGTGSWSVVSGPAGATITTPSSPTTTVTNLGVGVTVLRWTITQPGCAALTNDVSITRLANLEPAIAGPAQTTCTASTSLAATPPPVGTGAWTIGAGAPAGVTIETPASPTSGVTGLALGQTSSFVWTVSHPSCASVSASVAVTRQNAVTDAGAAQTVSGTNAGLVAVPAGDGVSVGTWTLVSGTGVFADPNSPTTTVSGLTASPDGSANVFRWTIQYPLPCGPQSATVTITATPFRLHIGIIVGAAIGGVIILAAIVVGIVFLAKWCHKHRSTASMYGEHEYISMKG